MLPAFLINTANLSSGGGLQVALSLLNEWRLREDCTFVVLLSPQLNELLNLQSFNSNFFFHHLPTNPSASFKALKEYRAVSNMLVKDHKAEAVLTVFGPSLWRPAVPHLCGFAQCLYLYPKSFFVKAIWLNSLIRKLEYAIKRSIMYGSLVKDTEAIWVETKHAADTLRQEKALSSKTIVVVPNTFNNAFLNQKTATLYSLSPAQIPFRIFTPSAAHPNKNLGLIKKLLLLTDNTHIQFLVTLHPTDFEGIFGMVKDDPRLINLGIIHPSELPKVYQTAHVVFLPSLLEVFSASWPEAMKMGLPIVAANLPFAKDICQEAALYFDPSLPKDALDKLLQVKNDMILQQALVAEGQRLLPQFISAGQRAEGLLDILFSLSQPKTCR